MKKRWIAVMLAAALFVSLFVLTACDPEDKPLPSAGQTGTPTQTDVENSAGSMQSTQPWQPLSPQYPLLVCTADTPEGERTLNAYAWGIEDGVLTRGEPQLRLADAQLYWDGDTCYRTDTKDISVLNEEIQIFPMQPGRKGYRYSSYNLCFSRGDDMQIIWTDAAGTDHTFEIDLRAVPVPELLEEFENLSAYCFYAAKEGDAFLLFFRLGVSDQMQCLRYLPAQPRQSTWSVCAVEEPFASGLVTTATVSRCSYAGGKLYMSTNDDILVYDISANTVQPLTQQLAQATALFPLHSQLSEVGVSVPYDACGSWGRYALLRLELSPLDASAEALTMHTILLAIDSNDDKIAGALVYSGERTGDGLLENPRVTIYDESLTEVARTENIGTALANVIVGKQRAE